MISDIVIIFVLIIIKGVTVAVSTSLSVLNIKKAKYLSDKDSKYYDKLTKIMERSQKDINAASIVNAFLGLVIGFILSMRIYNDCLNYALAEFIYVNDDFVKVATAIIILIVATYFFALFSIVIPKVLADKFPDKIVIRLSGLLHFVSLIIRPVTFLVDVAVRIFSIFLKAEKEDISEEEILMMVDASGEQGSIDEQEMEMINNIFEFDDKNCVEIATHRKDIVAVPKDITIDKLIDVVANEKFSRIPVYDEDIDDIIGILHIRDLMNVIIKGKDNFSIEDIIMEPYFVPETKKTNALFSEMQSKKIHMAVVADEYGGTAGIVTMEDLIEEVMGEIQDEYDEEEEPEIEELAENIIRIDGSTDLEDVAKSLGIEMPVDEYDTLGGFLVAKLDRIPEDGEYDIIVEYENCEFHIDEVVDKRIAFVTVIKREPEQVILED